MPFKILFQKSSDFSHGGAEDEQQSIPLGTIRNTPVHPSSASRCHQMVPCIHCCWGDAALLTPVSLHSGSGYHAHTPLRGSFSTVGALVCVE